MKLARFLLLRGKVKEGWGIKMMTDQECNDFDEGFNAYDNGDDLTANPFNMPNEELRKMAWQNGWIEAAKDNNDDEFQYPEGR